MRKYEEVEELKEELKGMFESLGISTKHRIIDRTMARLFNYLGVNESNVFDYYSYYTIFDCVAELVTSNHVMQERGGVKSHSTGNTSITFDDLKNTASDFDLFPIIRWW